METPRPDLPFDVVAVVPPGLEEASAIELAALGAEAVQPLRRAVACRTDLASFYRLHLQARLPFRFLRELARFPCRGREDLHAGVQRAADWDQWLPPERSFKVEASGSAPGLSHSHFSALQVKNALVDLQRQHWGQRSSIDLDDPDLVLHLHLGTPRGGTSRGGGGPWGGAAEAVLSLDGGGASLHRRGYRAAMGLAPLKENLAAGLIALTGWDGRVPLADPLCGSGTLLIEAACMALGRSAGLEGGGANRPGRARSFALQRWPDFNPILWQQEVEAATALARDGLADGHPLAPIVGMEAEAAVLEQARTNADAAGVGPWLDLRLGDFRSFEPPSGAPGLLVCNPPYGERLGDGVELEALYSDLGRMAKERCSGWTLWLLSGNPELTGALRMKASRRVPVSNGGIDCRWLKYELR
ncbi:class I SAM-dependent RNA methyltransferase [Synechococcus sp. Cruz-9H2]|uniref:THUMP domain-containing class I SAM-dependent RNA methyltransferase n=1 Tax=unclassified Synechococcus TaxID=2626047 RepID=UPI0020CD448B|nr:MULTISPECIES: THUMP domain-containing protein [unclassified Synechococcus]MCP9819627.1 class I SAM-dependent RNA methyltransferase [Synechococcus sp. Cruz-9H2]MCP9843932.1 class I SAM-dependent RNA methyltransferase [Synechococcus sp. Edmonson 11F2]MCP9856057.1 class I SAM-dependent RNA methyltransferase [Synechococcus sp. Cruz-9C9]MCP9863341.1 class I SAM-dependent RNA methyltransferase [Synechococcus sp. Cruz-7E5]MCP9870632.1 class I SAM-dependent RNA methyltransferase [Synechococcus sp. 